MKFTNGYWLPAEGVTVHNPYSVYNYEFSGKELKLYLPVKKTENRGDTLNGMLLTVTLSSPVKNMISVRAEHHAGTSQNKVSFDLSTDGDIFPDFRISDDRLVFTSGNLSAEINHTGQYEINFFHKGKYLCGSKKKSLGYAETGCGSRMKDELSLSVGELVYGLGERFTSFVKNGQTVNVKNNDSGTASEQAYKNIPFYVTNRGYGVFVNQTEEVSFEVASEKVNRVQFSVKGESIEYSVIGGDSLKDVITNYTALTGRPPLVPAWSLGLWLSTSFLTSYEEKTVTEFIEGMNSRGIPVDVFHFDCFWMREYHWCDFIWDSKVFPDPQGMLARLKKSGVKVSLWINPYISQQSVLFTEGSENGFLLKKTNGDVWQTDQWQAGMGIVDFTNPSAAEWFSAKLQTLLDMGADCFKTDFGERIPENNVVWHNGADPSAMRNYYSYIYNKTVYDLLYKNNPENAVLFARSATAGGQKFPVHWGGDCESTYEAMAESLRGGLSLSLCGFGYWSHDIGGFEGTPPADVYKRWCAFGLLSSHSRLHGSQSYRVPWMFDEEAVDVLKIFSNLKISLMPYLYSAVHEAAEYGIPLMRPMFLEFPDDPSCDHLDRQYMLGKNLLVAPVFTNDGQADFYLPAGIWTEWFSGESVKGGCWIRKRYDFRHIPLYVRENSIIAFTYGNRKAEHDYFSDTVFKIFRIDRESLCSVFSSSGNEKAFFKTVNSGNTVLITADSLFKNWTAELYEESSITAIKNCTAVSEGNYWKIIPLKCSESCEIKIEREKLNEKKI
ncbi:MAG: alpha-xylosidase [Spirochaetes bacterium]|nr:alpha-xylosidase [Spirochaetota bacterium]